MPEKKNNKSKIVIVDDEQDMRSFLEILLRRNGYSALSFPTAKRALEYCRANPFDLVITDLRMPEMDGVELLRQLKVVDEEAPVIMITAYASVDTAIDAMKAGAYDYFTKPFNIEEIKLNISKALEYRALNLENRKLKENIRAQSGVESIVSQSPVMEDIFRVIKGVAATKASVLITGESGTGKELIARAVHVEGDPVSSRFVAVNCGAIPENLMESELFGHMRGSFTGAVSDKEGLIEQADGGTLFLDEITEMPQQLQVKLLRFLQERSFRRIGGDKDLTVELRIVAASNKVVEEEVRAGRLREDLFFRLNVIHIELPPLRERRSDIPLLAEHFLGKYSAAHNKPVKAVSKDAMERLMGFNYPGNIRELENIIERAVAFSSSETIMPESLPQSLLNNVPGDLFAYDLEVPDNGLDIEKTVEDIEKEIIANALKKAGGVKKKAAELLGLSFRSMRYKISKYEIHED
ncbi:MAG: sigma-54-dependent transcriptional regulator [Thermodesulfobacteriota bacterium]